MDKEGNILPESDFTVVGASFAGSLLASKLAKHGKVLLIDKREPGSRLKCGGGVRAKEFETLGLDIPHVKIDIITMAGSGKTAGFKSGYVVVDRRELDMAILKKAVDSGVIFRKAEYLSHDPARNIFNIRIDGQIQEYAYKKLILAKGFDPAIQGKFYGSSYVEMVESRSRHEAELYFSLLQDTPGYCWIFPLPGGKVNVGIGSLSTRPFSKEVFRKFKEEQGITGRILCKGGGMIPLVPVSTVMDGNVYLFGDSAGMVFSANGEGLRNIIKMSDIWADCIANGKNLNTAWITNRTFIRLLISSIVVKLIAASGGYDTNIYNFLSRMAALMRRMTQ